MTIADMVLKQTRIERQETPRCASLSFDGQAANVFQACALAVPRNRVCAHPHAHRSYINQALGFSIQRAGFLYGETDAEGNVKAHVIYEPPQQVPISATPRTRTRTRTRTRALSRRRTRRGRATGLTSRPTRRSSGGWTSLRSAWGAHCVALRRSRRAEAAWRGSMTCVGWIFSASTAVERDYILSSKEILHMAALQAAGGEFFATARRTAATRALRQLTRPLRRWCRLSPTRREPPACTSRPSSAPSRL